MRATPSPPPQTNDLDWFPRMRAMSLSLGEAEGEVNDLRSLSLKLDNTRLVVDTLVAQLRELQNAVSTQGGSDGVLLVIMEIIFFFIDSFVY